MPCRYVPCLSSGLLEGAGPSPVVYTQEEITSEELAVDARVARALKRSGGKLTKLWGSSMYHLDDLPMEDLEREMPDIFTPFRERVEKKSQVWGVWGLG